MLRARPFAPDGQPGPVTTGSYFIGKRHALPVVSLATAPANLWSDERGIYVLGPNAEGEYPYRGANLWEDWERPVHLEFFELDGSLGFSMDAGIKVHGNTSRLYGQKTLALFARSCYGAGSIDYPLFPGQHIDEFEAILLRNSGTDWQETMYRDALVHVLTADTGLDVQAYRPAVVYLNGQYWGIHNIREKVNEHYLASHHGVDADGITLLERAGNVIQGDNRQYMALLGFIADNDLSVPANYEYVAGQIDIDNYLDYQVVEIFVGNVDWPAGNIKYWRSRRQDSRWRWILFDTDFAFGGRGVPYDHNTLGFVTEPDSVRGPNPPWSTLLFRTLLQNGSFRRDLVNRFADHMNTTFEPDRVVATIRQMQAALEPEMPAHSARWGTSVPFWRSHVAVLVEFALNRAAHVRRHVAGRFGLDGTAELVVQIIPPEAGVVHVNSLRVAQPSWSGSYFMGNPIELRAVPKAGYRFAGWTGAEIADASGISLELTGDAALRAVFEASEEIHARVVINEINYNSTPLHYADDWVELYNDGDVVIDLSHWSFSDSRDDHAFAIPDGTALDPGGYLVLCRDSNAFARAFPSVRNHIGDFGFGLSGAGETVRVFDSSAQLVDEAVYGDEAPWPPSPDGNGPTLSLKEPSLDNADPTNWCGSTGNGTPGRSNERSCAPNALQVGGNYPNPFNDMTTVPFYLPEAGSVRVTLHNLLGQHIADLYRGPMAAGQHTVSFVAGDLAGGTYLCKVESAGASDVTTMTLVK